MFIEDDLVISIRYTKKNDYNDNEHFETLFNIIHPPISLNIKRMLLPIANHLHCKEFYINILFEIELSINGEPKFHYTLNLDHRDTVKLNILGDSNYLGTLHFLESNFIQHETLIVDTFFLTKDEVFTDITNKILNDNLYLFQAASFTNIDYISASSIFNLRNHDDIKINNSIINSNMEIFNHKDLFIFFKTLIGRKVFVNFSNGFECLLKEFSNNGSFSFNLNSFSEIPLYSFSINSNTNNKCITFKSSSSKNTISYDCILHYFYFDNIIISFEAIKNARKLFNKEFFDLSCDECEILKMLNI